MKTIDLSPRLRDARRHPKWSPQLLAVTLARLSHAVPGSKVDHDGEAGEEWGRLLLADVVVAILWSRGGFAFVHRDFAGLVPLLTSAGVISEVVADWDAPSYGVQPEDLRVLFEREAISDAVDPDKLSANDLWWATT